MLPQRSLGLMDQGRHDVIEPVRPQGSQYIEVLLIKHKENKGTARTDVQV